MNRRQFEILYLIVIILLSSTYVNSIAEKNSQFAKGAPKNSTNSTDQSGFKPVKASPSAEGKKENSAKFSIPKADIAFPPLNKIIRSDCFMENSDKIKQRIKNNMIYFRTFFKNINFPQKDQFLTAAAAIVPLYKAAEEDNKSEILGHYSKVKPILGDFAKGKDLVKTTMEIGAEFQQKLIDAFNSSKNDLNEYEKNMFQNYLIYAIYEKETEEIDGKCLDFENHVYVFPSMAFDNHSMNSNKNTNFFNPQMCRDKMTKNVYNSEFDKESIGENGMAFSFFYEQDLTDLKENGVKKIFEMKFAKNAFINFETYQKENMIFSRLRFDNIAEQTKPAIFADDHYDELNCRTKAFAVLTIQKFEDSYKIITSIRYPIINSRTTYAFVLPAEYLEKVEVDFSVDNVLKTCDFPYSIENEIKLFNHQIWEGKLIENFFETYNSCDKDNFPNCKFAGKEKCEVCMNLRDPNQFFLFQGKCIEKCPDGTYRNTDNPLLPACLPCKENCLLCDKADECKKCDLTKDFYLKKGKCVKTCGDGFFQKAHDDHIECKECTDKFCEKCEADICSDCHEGHFLTYTETSTKCVAKCADGFYGDVETGECKKCQDNCDLCSSENQCDKCTKPFIYDTEQKICVEKCPQGYTSVQLPKALHKVCRKCQDKNALSCEDDKPDKSLECRETFLLLAGKKKCEKKAICTEGSFYDAILNKCKKCPKGCTKCEDASHCTACEHGHEPINGVCVTKCPANKTLVNGRCVNCTDPLCQNCDEDLSCIKCQKGTFIYMSQCHQICPKGTYGDHETGECLPCDEHCVECDNAVECNVCDKEYALFIDGSCVKECPENFYGKCSGTSTKCELCDRTCKTCKGSNPEDCLECKQGFKKINGLCRKKIKCPEGTVVMNDKCIECNKMFQNCAECGATECNKCQNGFELTADKHHCEFVPKDITIFEEVRLYDYYTTKAKKINQSVYSFKKELSDFGTSFRRINLSFNIKLVRNFDAEKGLTVFKIDHPKSQRKISFDIFQGDCIWSMQIDEDHHDKIVAKDLCKFHDLTNWRHVVVGMDDIDNKLKLNLFIEGKVFSVTHGHKTDEFLQGFKEHQHDLFINPDASGTVFELSNMKIFRNPINTGLYDFLSQKPKQCDFACEKCVMGLCHKCKDMEETKTGLEECPVKNIELEGNDFVLSTSQIFLRDIIKDKIPNKDPYVQDKFGIGGWFYPKFDKDNFKPFKLSKTEYQNSEKTIKEKICDIVFTSPSTMSLNGSPDIPVEEMISNKFYYVLFTSTRDTITIYTSNNNKKGAKGEEGYTKKISFPHQGFFNGFIFEDLKIYLPKGDNIKSTKNIKLFYNNIPDVAEINKEVEEQEEDENCEEYDPTGKCIKCKQGAEMVQRHGKCAEKSVTFKINEDSVMTFWDNEERIFNIEDKINKDLDKKLTFSFFIRRKAIHAKIHGAKDVHNVDQPESVEKNPFNKGTNINKLFSLGDTDNNLFNIVSVRNRQKDNDIEFLLRTSNHTFKRIVYRDHKGLFPYVKIVVSVDLKKKVFNYIIGEKTEGFHKVVEGSLENNLKTGDNMKLLKFGDIHGKEMNMEIVGIELDSIFLDKNAIKKADVNKENFPVPCTWNCVKCDILDQNPKKKCKLCYNKKKNKSSCGFTFHGFSYISKYQSRLPKETQLTPSEIVLDTDQYDLTNKNNGRNILSYYKSKPDLFAQSYNYSVLGNLFLYKDGFTDDKNELNVWAINNIREKNNFKYKNDMNVNGINTLRMDIIKDNEESARVSIKLRIESTNKIVKIDDIRLNMQTWVWYNVKVVKNSLIVWIDDTKGKRLFSKQVKLENNPVAVNDNSSLIKNFGKFQQQLSFASIITFLIPNDSFTNGKFYRYLKSRLSQVKNYQYWNYQQCKEDNCRVCSQIFYKNKDQKKNDNKCLDCNAKFNLIDGKCQKAKQVISEYESINTIMNPGYVINEFEEKIISEENIDEKKVINSFYFRRNYINDGTHSENKKFYEFWDIDFHLKNDHGKEYVTFDMEGRITDEKLFDIKLEDSNAWFRIEIVISRYSVEINSYKVAGGTEEKIDTVNAHIVFKLRSLIGDSIKAHTLDSQFSFHTIRLDINDNGKDMNIPLPHDDIYSYSYPEVNDYKDHIVTGGAANYLSTNNDENRFFIDNIVNVKSLRLEGKDLPLDIHIDDLRESIYPKDRVYVSNRFNIQFNMMITAQHLTFNELLNILKVNNNKKMQSSISKIQHPLSNIIQVQMRDENTLLFTFGDKEKYIKNGNRVQPIEFKSKTSLLNKHVRFFINKTPDAFEIFVFQSNSNKFYHIEKINDYAFSKLTNDGRVYLFDNDNSINNKLGVELLNFKISPSSEGVVGEDEYQSLADKFRYSHQENCVDENNDNDCSMCKSGVYNKKEKMCLSSTSSNILIGKTPVFPNKKDKVFNISTNGSMEGYNLSFSLRNHNFEKADNTPLFTLNAAGRPLLSVSLNAKGLHISDIAGMSEVDLEFPNKPEVNALREIFVNINNNYHSMELKANASAYEGDQEKNNKNSESSNAMGRHNRPNQEIHADNLELVFLNNASGDYYIHSLVFDANAKASSNLENRVRSRNTCNKLCKFDCSKNGGVCPLGYEYTNKLDLSISSLGTNLEDVIKQVPILRRIRYGDEKNTRDAKTIFDKFMLSFDINIQDLQKFDTKQGKQHTLFSLNNRRYSNTKSLRLSDKLPHEVLDESLLNMRANLCDGNAETNCRKELIVEFGFGPNASKKKIKVALEEKKKIHRLSVAVYVRNGLRTRKNGGTDLNSKLFILVEQNNEIIFQAPSHPIFFSALTSESFIYNHPILSNVNLNVINPNINRMFWNLRSDRTVFGSDPANNFCAENNSGSNSEVYCDKCFEKQCILCSPKAYLDKDGKCRPRIVKNAAKKDE